jgi:menaquinone-dependent protoporphyrinogen oxidase
MIFGQVFGFCQLAIPSGGKMSKRIISRRSFLKLGCLTGAAAGLTVCRIGLAAPDLPSIALPSFSFGDMTMKQRILIAYASATGSTVEVAAAMGEALAAGGLAVDVRAIRENPQLAGYRAVVIGSAVQHGNWLPEAVEFVRANREALGRVPAALFCVHITNLGDDEASRRNRQAFLNPVRPLLQPVAEAFFAGKFDRRGAALLLPGWLARFIPPMDFRDWKKIRTWGESIRPLVIPPS